MKGFIGFCPKCRRQLLLSAEHQVQSAQPGGRTFTNNQSGDANRLPETDKREILPGFHSGCLFHVYVSRIRTLDRWRDPREPYGIQLEPCVAQGRTLSSAEP